MESFKSGFPNDLTSEWSPSIPKAFPKELIPKNICEKEYIDLTKCMYVLGPRMQCQIEYADFLMCKKERDSKLFSEIKKWEISHFKELTPNMQNLYKMGLNTKLQRLKSELEQMPEAFVYQNKRQRYQADIDQIGWRLIFVQPYEHVYKTNAKKRWQGKALIEAMSDEFRAYTREYYQQAILDGKITINQRKVNPQYILSDHDLIEHKVVRVEPPILDIPIKIVEEDDDYVIVSKPPSMIVHTGGGYHYNCLVALLYFEWKPIELFVLHRLDRLTSGLLLLSKNKKIAQQFHDANSKNVVKKIYLARVHGNFPDDISQTDRPIYCVSMKDAVFAACSHEEAKQKEAKEAKTLLKKLSYDEATDSSLIECSLITGKTHQIRVHLSDLGYPILNDIGYGGKFVGNKIINKYFPNLEDRQIQQKEVLDQNNAIKQNVEDIRIKQKEDVELNFVKQNQQAEQLPQIFSQDNPEIIVKKVYQGQNQDILNQEPNIQDKKYQEEQKIAKKYEQIDEPQEVLQDCLAGKKEWDYSNHPLEIYLHSWKYTHQGRQFECDPPYWM